MKKVRCVSPHGGCHNGMDSRGNPVHALPDGTIPEPDGMLLPPNPGGYIGDARILGRHAAVGQVYDVPDDFAADGFHWVEDETGKATEPPKPPPAAPPPPAGTKTDEGTK